MNKTHIKAHLAWLSAALTAQRTILSTILSRLRGFGASAEASPALHPKFMRLLTQAAHHKEKEDNILDEIEAMEKRHQALKIRKELRHAPLPPLYDHGNRGGRAITRDKLRHQPRAASSTESEHASTPNIPAQRRSSVWKWLTLFFFLTPQEKNNKRQDITPN